MHITTVIIQTQLFNFCTSFHFVFVLSRLSKAELHFIVEKVSTCTYMYMYIPVHVYTLIFIHVSHMCINKHQ